MHVLVRSDATSFLNSRACSAIAVTLWKRAMSSGSHMAMCTAVITSDHVDKF